MDGVIPLVSVIIPVRNDQQKIHKCLVSLLKMDYPPDRREILVVDDDSTDQTAEIINRFPVQYLRQERPGSAAARNRGIEASRSEVLAFTDADCVVSTGGLRELVQGFENEKVGAVAGEVVAYPPKTPAERYIAVLKPLWQIPVINSRDSQWFDLTCAAFRREVFDKIGLFDPRFVAGEGTDFCRRFFQDKRFELRYRPKAVVFHRHRASARELFGQYHSYGYGQALLCRKYRREHLWDWHRELAAHKDLLLTALAFGRAAIRSRLRGWDTPECSYLYFELIRKLGARIGFIRGTVRRDAGRG